MRISRRRLLMGAAASVPTLSVLEPFGALASVTPTYVGAVEDILNVAWGTPPGFARGELEHQDPIFMNEMIETDGESALEVVFGDGSRLTVGESSAVVIDEFVYDPASVGGVSTIGLAKGVFRYLSGEMPKESVTINTPTMTTGIRGTELKFTVREDGETEMSALSGVALCRSRISGRELVIRDGESALMAADGRWAGGVRAFVHRAGSPAIDDGLEEARRRWALRKERRRRNEPRQGPRGRIRLPTEQ